MKSLVRAEAQRGGEGELFCFPPLRALRLCANLVFLGLAACSTPPVHTDRANTVIVVPGIGGDGPVYAQILDSLREHGDRDCLRVCDWGSSYPIFFISISCKSWHEHVERDLAKKIETIRAAHSDARI